MAFNIGKEEVKHGAGYVLLAFFGFYILEPAREILSEKVPLAPIVIGIIGVAATLYFFEFK
jgi:hypothetical protein